MKTIAMIIAFNRFRDEELLVPLEVFSKAGAEVSVFSTEIGLATGKLGATFQVENTLEQLDPTSFDAIVIVGGPGGYDYRGNHKLQAIMNRTLNDGKLLAAICMAPLLLAEAGLLKNKKATVTPSEIEAIVSCGAIYNGADVEVDGNIITGNGPEAAEAFAEAIIQKLT